MGVLPSLPLPRALLPILPHAKLGILLLLPLLLKRRKNEDFLQRAFKCRSEEPLPPTSLNCSRVLWLILNGVKLSSKLSRFQRTAPLQLPFSPSHPFFFPAPSLTQSHVCLVTPIEHVTGLLI